MDAPVIQEWLARELLGNSIQAYLVAVAIFVTVLAVTWLVKTFVIRHLHQWTQATTTDIDDFVVELFQRLNPLTYLVVALYIASRAVVLGAFADKSLRVLFIATLTLQGIQLLQTTLVFFVTRWSARADRSQTSAAAVKNLALIARSILWFAAFLFILDNLGINITAAVAGLGIGGIAVALAAQAVLGDAFSAFAIFMDRPFEVGDFIIVGELLGTVEHVGFKTTRVRSLGGEQLVFSNSDLTSSRIRNYKRMQMRRIVFSLGVIYQTTLEHVRAIPEIIKSVVEEHELAQFDRSHFQKYGDFALIYETVYYVKTGDYNTYMDVQQSINFRIMEEFKRRHIEFAYPTQQVFHTQVS